MRVDDDPQPVARLAQLVSTHHLFFGTPHPEDALPITADIASELQHMMAVQGYYLGDINGQWDALTRAAFWDLVGNENLEERWNPDRQPDYIDRVALEYLRERFGG